MVYVLCQDVNLSRVFFLQQICRENSLCDYLFIAICIQFLVIIITSRIFALVFLRDGL